jgi:hypothetical protein
MKRIVPGITALNFIALSMPVALGGNRAVTTFDSLPDEFAAGETYDLTYTILQHAATPVDVGSSTVVFVDAETGDLLSFEAIATGERGKYAVTVTLPRSGEWQWRVTQGQFAAHELGVLHVGEMVATTSTGAMALRVLLPICAFAAALFTIRELMRARSPSPESLPQAS